MLDDDILSAAEESQLIAVMDALGIDQAQLASRCPDVMSRILVGKYQDGRLPIEPHPQLLAKRGEIVHAEIDAVLLKEVVHREYRGGGAGISFPIFPGVRMGTGGFRARSVVVGTSLEAADEGVLSFTNSRAVFQGAKRTLEFRYEKMTGVEAYTDGLRMSVSNRQAASLFRVQDGQAACALVLVAAQRVGQA